MTTATRNRKEYAVDSRGFLIRPEDWDEEFAVNKAQEMKMPSVLTDEHWRIIRYLRDAVKETGEPPNVTTTCEDNGLELEDPGSLFPDGYHRGAVKIAGLRF